MGMPGAKAGAAKSAGRVTDADHSGWYPGHVGTEGSRLGQIRTAWRDRLHGDHIPRAISH